MLSKLPYLLNCQTMQQFLGMIRHYHCFFPAIYPLYASLKGKPKVLKWGSHEEAAFYNAKNPLSTTLVFEQLVNSSPCPLVFFSRKLSRAESGYSTFDCELIVVHMAVYHFHLFLEDALFIIKMDHMPLVQIFTQQFNA
ncbi:uncharacterized protein [Palaemon carinicauda]|uniref:uncharacterized protein n=1 Tax=Palaemon carinicauda TaxID=392227 RepID=UPI0035B58674